MALTVVHVEGEPYAQGHQHGVALRDQIGHNLAVYYDRFQREVQLGPEEARARAARYQPRLDGGPYFDALKGMAAGSGHALLDLLVLNVRYELLYYEYGVCGVSGPDGCTAFAVLPPASATGHLLLGQNWDWIPEVRGAVLHSREPDGLETLTFTEAGIVGGKLGLNSTGLGLTINGRSRPLMIGPGWKCLSTCGVTKSSAGAASPRPCDWSWRADARARRTSCWPRPRTER